MWRVLRVGAGTDGVFSGNELTSGFHSLMVINPDGTGVRRLTRSHGDNEPSWSPDETRVVFERTAGASCDPDHAATGVCAQIWIVDADGTDERRLTAPSARAEQPDWSPDGGSVVFQQWNTPPGQDPGQIGIYVINVDGSGLRQLTEASAENTDPAWSPDGDRIAFTRQVEDDYKIWVMNADGSEQRRLTQSGVLQHSPAWSPDGDEIAVVRRLADGADAIAVINADGSAERMLSPPGEPDAPPGYTQDGSPVWSPDGSQIAFVRDDIHPGFSEIWVIDADGANPHRVPVCDPPHEVQYCEPWGLDWTAAP